MAPEWDAHLGLKPSGESLIHLTPSIPRCETFPSQPSADRRRKTVTRATTGYGESAIKKPGAGPGNVQDFNFSWDGKRVYSPVVATSTAWFGLRTAYRMPVTAGPA